MQQAGRQAGATLESGRGGKNGGGGRGWQGPAQRPSSTGSSGMAPAGSNTTAALLLQSAREATPSLSALQAPPLCPPFASQLTTQSVASE
jgi:hypothetical protein